MNKLMMKFLVAVKEHQKVGGFLNKMTGLDPLETNIAIRVGVEYGWLTDGCKLTENGYSVLSEVNKYPLLISDSKTLHMTKISFLDLYADREGLSKSLYDHVSRNMPKIMMAALEEVYCQGISVEKFEKDKQIPLRSCNTIIRCALENYDLIMKQAGFTQ